MATREAEIKERLLRLKIAELKGTQTSVSRPATPQEEERARIRNELAESASPLTGVGHAFSQMGIGAKQLGILTTDLLGELRPPILGGQSLKQAMPTLFDIPPEEFDRLARKAKNNQELFDILAERRPNQDVAAFLTMLGTSLVFPEARATAGPRALRTILTAPRRPTVVTEIGAGVTQGAIQPAQSPGEMFANAFGGGVTGAAFHPFATMVSASGRMLAGGRPAAIQRTEELLQAERDLQVVGLLTAGELRQGRVLGRIEGILDNLPAVGIGLSGKRELQQEQFQNAVNTIRAAFPDIGGEQVLNMIRSQLEAQEVVVRRAFDRVARSVPEGADFVEPSNYVAKAQEMLARELEKGSRADPSVVQFLKSQTEVDSVPFSAAQELSSDLARRVRVANRAAQDPTQTGIDAGRLKQLSLAHFKDMEHWARQTGGDTLDLWQSAKQQFKELVLPFQKRPLAPIFDEGTDSYKLSRLILNPESAGKLAKLDKRGALGFLLINDALEQSATKTGDVDVKKFVSLLSQARRHKALERLVPEESQKLLLGLAKLVDASPRAFIKPTGGQVLSTTAGTAGVIGAGSMVSESQAAAAAIGLASIGTIRWLVGSRSGRALLTMAARTSPANRKRLAELAVRARTLTSRLAITSALNPDIQTEAERRAEVVIGAQ